MSKSTTYEKRLGSVFFGFGHYKLIISHSQRPGLEPSFDRKIKLRDKKIGFIVNGRTYISIESINLSLFSKQMK